MADPASFGLPPRLDIEQLFNEAQHRWLRPAEICEILRNYQKFQIQTNAPNRPPSGSLFLFDRKVMRYFRKDGHNWRKKKDGKTVKEAHEKLKVGSIDVLHCYYAHGEENENFQRRSYWLLEQDLMHIVFVHYLEVKSNRAGSSPINSFSANPTKEQSGNTDAMSPTSTLSSLYEDVDSADSQQANGVHESYRSQIGKDQGLNNINDDFWRLQKVATRMEITKHSDGQASTSEVRTLTCNPEDILASNNHFTSWKDMYGFTADGGTQYHPSTTPFLEGDYSLSSGTSLDQIVGSRVELNVNNAHSLPDQSNWHFVQSNDGLGDLAYNEDSWAEQRTHVPIQDDVFDSLYSPDGQPSQQLAMDEFLIQLSAIDSQHVTDVKDENDVFEGSRYSHKLKHSLLHGDETLKKVDSFSRWISKELVVDDLKMRSSSSIPWSSVECDDVVDCSSLSPFLSQDQLFSVKNFSPKWTFANSETEVFVIGSFLVSEEEMAFCKWSCMFGEVEVPAQVIIDGVLCCQCPSRGPGRVPFYVTKSNRLACSEIREFDYQEYPPERIDIREIYSDEEMHLYLQLERFLSIRSWSSTYMCGGDLEMQKRVREILSIKEQGEIYQVPDPSVEKFKNLKDKMEFVELQTKEKFFSWLVHKVCESDKGPSVLDVEGQGVLHLTAGLGYDWAIEPIITAGVSINFRDVNGWTALHWSAFCGREQTVALLVSLGALTGALTDPSPENPLGRTPADLASENGHKGISGFLAESSLTNFLKDLTVNDGRDNDLAAEQGIKAVQTVAEKVPVPLSCNNVHDDLSMKDSLSAIRNATQAASRIFQVFRMQSFQRKKLVDENGELDACTASLLAPKAGNPDGTAHAAATHIQKKYRGWKKRKEFLIIRQRIVKLQAHVRGHQVRKQYKPIIWSVGILEKVILRWRRKGSGLRGFRRDTLTKEPNVQPIHQQEDSYDVLKEGIKQNEERMHHALTRVKSMIHYPEARAQYRRLLTVAENFREAKEMQQGPQIPLDIPEDLPNVDENIDLDSLLDDDTFMSIAFE